MGELLILFVAVLVFCLLWIGIDQIAALLPASGSNPPLPLAVIGHILLLLAACWWLVTRYL